MKTSKSAITAPLYATIVMILLGVSGKLLEISVTNSADDFFFTAVILELFVYMIPAAFYCKIRGVDLLKASGVRYFSPSDLPFVISMFFVYVLGALFLLYLGFVPAGTATDMTLTLRTIPETDSVFVALCYIVIPAVAEETIFRSLLLQEYRPFKGVFSLILTSVFFAMIHFSFSAFLFYFWGGLVLGLLTLVTHSALPSVILHMLSNAVSLYFSDTISGFLNSAENSVVVIFLMSTLFILALYLAAGSMQSIYERKSEQYENGTLRGCRVDAIARLSKAGKVEKNKKTQVVAQGVTTRDMFLSPTVLLAVCVYIFITIGVI